MLLLGNLQDTQLIMSLYVPEKSFVLEIYKNRHSHVFNFVIFSLCFCFI